MPKLINTDEITGKSFIELLKDKEVIVYEDVQGARIWVSWNGTKWVIRPKTVNNDPINMVDLAMQKFYNQAYLYFSTLSPSVTYLLNKNWQFGFEYFCDEQPANVKYDKVPKNNLVLTCINKGYRRYSYDIDELKTYSDLFDTDCLPVIYRGRLSERQIQLINKFLHTSKHDLEFIFKDTNFSNFFYSILNPNLKNSFLMNNGFQTNLERVIIRFVDKNEELSLEVLNPLYSRISAEVSTEYVEIYSILLTNFVQFLHTIDINAVSITGEDKHILYLNLICKLYNMYMQQSADDINQFIFTIPPFFSQEKFAVEKQRITNQITKSWINKSKKNEYIFKIIIGAFKTYKKKPVGVFTESFLTIFNSIVDLIWNRIDKELIKDRDVLKYKNDLNRSFNNKQLNVEYETDANGDLYFNKNKQKATTSDKNKKLALK